MSRSLLALLALVLLSPTLRSADNLPKERTTNDRQIIDALAKLHDRGAALFNSGDYGGCYRLFQGSLSTIKLVLPTDLQEEVERGLTRAESEMDPTRRALILHDLIENVRKKLHPTAGKLEVLPAPRKTSDGLEPPKANPMGSGLLDPNPPKTNPMGSGQPESNPPKRNPMDPGRPEPVHLGGAGRPEFDTPKLNPMGPGRAVPVHPNGDIKIPEDPMLTVPPLPDTRGRSSNEPPKAPAHPSLGPPVDPKVPTGPNTEPPLDPTPSSIPAVPTSNPKKPKNSSPPEPSPEVLSIPPRPDTTKPSAGAAPNRSAAPSAMSSDEPPLALPPAGTFPPKEPSLPMVPLPSSGPMLPSNGPTIPSSGPSLPSTVPTLPSTSPTLPSGPGPVPSTGPTLPSIPMSAGPSGELPLAPLPMAPTKPTGNPARTAPSTPGTTTNGLPELTAPPLPAPPSGAKLTTPTSPDPLPPPPGK